MYLFRWELEYNSTSKYLCEQFFYYLIHLIYFIFILFFYPLLPNSVLSINQTAFLLASDDGKSAAAGLSACRIPAAID
jgi:hypothetical protein